MKGFRFLLLLAVLAGCRQELPPEMVGDPLFYAKGTIGGSSFDLQAGEKGYIMDGYSGRDAYGVNTFSGTLKQVNCEDCPESLTVTFRDHRVSVQGEPLNLDSVFLIGPYAFQGGAYEPDPNTFEFSARKGGKGPHFYSWDFGDGHTSTDSTPVHTYDHSGDFQVSLKVTDLEGCTDVSRNQVSAGTGFNACSISYDIEHLGNNRVRYLARPSFTGAGPSLVLWDLGDGTSLTGVFEVDHTYRRAGIYEVKLVYIDSNGCFSCDLQNVYSLPQPSCASAIRYRSAPADRQVGRAVLEWVDERGDRYTSLDPEGQPGTSYFELLEAEPYKPDLDGDATVKVRVRFSCRLYKAGDPETFLDLSGGEAVVAIGVL